MHPAEIKAGIRKVFSRPTGKEALALHGLMIIMLLMVGSDFSAIQGSQASKLNLPFAWLTRWTPFVACLAYCTSGFLLRHTVVKLVRWVAAYGIGALVIGFPIWVIATYAQPIQTNRFLMQEERVKLQSIFPHPYVEGLSQSGHHLLINRKDYDPVLVGFLQSIQVHRKAADRKN